MGSAVSSDDRTPAWWTRAVLYVLHPRRISENAPPAASAPRACELWRITSGEGEEGDIELLEELGEVVSDTAMCGLGQTAPNPVLSTIRYFRDEYEEHIRDKYCRASVCGSMFISPCENTCPANINVPGYLRLIAAGRFTDAYNLIRQENPFPAVCGRICTHPCEAKCRRGTLDESIAICELKRFVADYAYKHEKPYSSDVDSRARQTRRHIGAGLRGQPAVLPRQTATRWTYSIRVRGGWRARVRHSRIRLQRAFCSKDRTDRAGG